MGMDKDFVVFALVKGKDYVVEQTGIDRQEVGMLVDSMSQSNHIFFEKIVGLMTDLSNSTSIEFASEFFDINVEAFRAITDHNQENIYLEKVKQYIKSKSAAKESPSKPQQEREPLDALPIFEIREPPKKSVSIPVNIENIRNPNNYKINNKFINIKELSEHNPRNKNIFDPDYSRIEGQSK